MAWRSLGPAEFAPWPTAAGLLALLTILDAGLSATGFEDDRPDVAPAPEELLETRGW